MGGNDNNEFKVPKQADGHLCGWRVLLNAELLLQRIYGNLQGSVSTCFLFASLFLTTNNLYVYVSCVMLQARQPADYRERHVESFRTRMVEILINNATTRPDGVLDAFIPPVQRPAPGPPHRRYDNMESQQPEPIQISGDSLSPNPSFLPVRISLALLHSPHQSNPCLLQLALLLTKKQPLMNRLHLVMNENHILMYTFVNEKLHKKLCLY